MNASPRRLSRWMPPLPDRTMSPRAFAAGCAVLAAFAGVLLYLHPPFRFVAAAVVLFFTAMTFLRDRRARRLAAERVGESICTFARALDRRAVDPWVIRAVHDALRPYADFPIRASDSLDGILGVYGDELDDVARDVAERTGRTLDGSERNPVRVRTAGDLVRFFSHSPASLREMTMDKSLVPISKFVSKVLRHAPESVGLRLDEAGWVDVDDLLAAANRAGVGLDRPTLERVVAENDKQRFALSDDGLRIRASQGHSVAVELGLEPVVPPDVLFHGTADRNLDSIRAQGLVPGRRTHVHLSADEATAVNVGQRHGRPVVLRVQAGEMHRTGHPFFRSDNGVWLTAAVPGAYIRFPE